MLQDGERQVAPTIGGIRHDHVARYSWAAEQLRKPTEQLVIDAACGVGYGSWILAEDGNCRVLGVDRDAEALAYGAQHYSHDRVSYRQGEADRLLEVAGEIFPGAVDVAVCFETIEHLENPLPLLVALREKAATLLASVPNEDVYPYAGQSFHHRHYTARQFQALLGAAGWHVESWWGQLDDEAEVERDRAGRTLVVVARAGAVSNAIIGGPAVPYSEPERVAILGLGPSVAQYLDLVKRHGGRGVFYDEVWAINALGDVLVADKVFHMDDVRIQEIRAKARPESNIAAMLKWLKHHPGPVVTSRAHPDYPGLVEFPLEAVINRTRFPYFNSTAACALAYAVYLHLVSDGRAVKKLAVYGNDFTYGNSHHAERGRACVEFWLGYAAALGIKLTIPKTSSLMDACHSQADRLYGYDTLAVSLKDTGKRIDVSFAEMPELPSAEEIERRYDHSTPVQEQVASKGEG